MQTAIEVFAIANLTVTGLSHIVQHRAWAEFFIWLHGLGRPGVFCNAAIHFLFGTLIISFHNVWHGLPTLLTVLGWAVTTKAALYFCVPALGARSMSMVTLERSRRFIPAGCALLVVAGALIYALLQE